MSQVVQFRLALTDLEALLRARRYLGSVGVETREFQFAPAAGTQRKVQPVYPAQALAQHLEGSVVLQATVAEDGKVQNVSALRGDPLLARAAVDAVKQWQYDPFREDGKAIQKQTEITIDFKEH